MPTPALSLPQHSLSNPSVATTHPQRTLASWWPWFDGRRNTARPAAGGERRAFERRRQQIVRSARNGARFGQALRLGSIEQPYVPTALEGVSAAAVLRSHNDLCIEIVAATPHLLDELDLWRELDQHHAVAVEIPLVLGRSAVLNGQQDALLHLARRIAEVGLETRIRLHIEGTCSPDHLRQLSEEAVACGVTDLLLAPGDLSLPPGLGLLFRQLRLQLDLPRPLPGRG